MLFLTRRVADPAARNVRLARAVIIEDGEAAVAPVSEDRASERLDARPERRARLVLDADAVALAERAEAAPHRQHLRKNQNLRDTFNMVDRERIWG